MAGLTRAVCLAGVCAILPYMLEGVKKKGPEDLEEDEVSLESSNVARGPLDGARLLDEACQTAEFSVHYHVWDPPIEGESGACGPLVSTEMPIAADEHNESAVLSQPQITTEDRRALRSMLTSVVALVAFAGLIWNLAAELFHLSKASCALSVQFNAEQRLRPNECQMTQAQSVRATG